VELLCRLSPRCRLTFGQKSALKIRSSGVLYEHRPYLLIARHHGDLSLKPMLGFPRGTDRRPIRCKPNSWTSAHSRAGCPVPRAHLIHHVNYPKRIIKRLLDETFLRIIIIFPGIMVFNSELLLLLSALSSSFSRSFFPSFMHCQDQYSLLERCSKPQQRSADVGPARNLQQHNSEPFVLVLPVQKLHLLTIMLGSASQNHRETQLRVLI
jgi:hypothetical protein